MVTLFVLAIAVLYLAVFVEASVSKIAALETPAWFVEKFKPTWLGRVPAPLLWWPIAVAELLVALGVGFGALGWLFDLSRAEDVLVGAQLLAVGVFAALCFGLRVSQDYVGAANAFFYGALSALLAGLTWAAIAQLPPDPLW